MSFSKNGKSVYDMSVESLRQLTDEERSELSTEESIYVYRQLNPIDDDLAEAIARFNDPDQYSYRYG